MQQGKSFKSLQYPVDNFRDIMRACRADEPLEPDDPRRYDFTQLRGGHSILNDFADTLDQNLDEGEFHHMILCGHRGCGKSTELLTLKQWADKQDFLTLWIEVDLLFKHSEVQFSDLYLLSAEAVAREMEQAKLPLDATLLDQVIQWFANVTKEDLDKIKSEISLVTEAEIKAPLAMFGKLLARFAAGITAGSEHHLKVQQTFKQAPNTLIDLTNVLLNEANTRLAKAKRTRGLLLLFDNLDRYDADKIRNLLIHQANLVRKMACHALFTMPIRIMSKSDHAYWDDYGTPIVLPMPALRTPGATWNKTAAASPFQEEAVSEMLAALEKRIRVEVLFETVEDARLLVKMSGGCMRDLLHLITEARKESRANPDDVPSRLTSQGVQRGINAYRATLTEPLREEDYRRLAQIARRKPGADAVDDSLLRLFNLRAVLKYKKQDSNSWTDVHPLVIEKEEFQRAYNEAADIQSA